MKKYPAYKMSDIEWIGEIPRGWGVKKLKYIAKVENGATPSSSNPDYWEGFINWFTPADLEKSNDIYLHESQRKITKKGLESCGTTLVPKNSIILSNRAPIGSIGILSQDGCTNQGCKAITFKEGNFLYYFFVLLTTKGELESLGNGATFKEISSNSVKNLKVIFPSIIEQNIIANLLYQKLQAINTLISKKQKLIDLLKEERASIINQAVTKGIEPSVELKDSGIEWLGKIPKSWNRGRLKQLVSIKITDGPHETPQFIDDGVPFISAESIKDNKIDYNDKRGYISQKQFEIYAKKSKSIKNDILFCKSGSTTGKSALVETDIDFAIWSPLAIIRANPKLMNYEYLFNVLLSKMFQDQVKTSWTFGTQPNIGMNAIENLWVTIPSLKAQQEIISYFKKEFFNIDITINKIQKEIDLLQEYRTTLISEVVTGKIDVRGEVN